MKLIDKDALVAEIERGIKINKECMLGLRNLDYYQGKVDALNDINSFLDTIEVKEVQEEPVSEDLEEAAVEAFKEIVDDERNSFLEIFKAGANWKKEQMMAKAVDGEVGYWNLRGLSVNVELPHSIEEGDKVKVIVIKEN